MTSNVSVSKQPQPKWVRWVIFGIGLVIGLVTALVFVCMKQYESTQNNPYVRVPVKSFGGYMQAAMDPTKQKPLLDALSKLSAYRQGNKYSKAQLAEHEEDLRSAIDLFAKTMGEENEYVVLAYDKLGECCIDQKKYVEAEQAYTKAVAINERSCGPENRITAAFIVDLADVKKELKKYDEARKLLERNYAIRKKYEKPNSHVIGLAAENIGNCYSDQDKFKEAEPYYREALQVQTALNNDSSERRRLIEWIGWLKVQQNDLPGAIPYYQEAIQIEESLKHPEKVANLHFDLGMYYSNRSRYEQAIAEYERCEQLAADNKFKDKELLPGALEWKGCARMYQGRYEDALTETDRAQKSLEESHLTKSPMYVRCLTQKGDILLRLQKDAKAEDAFEKAIAMYKDVNRAAMTPKQFSGNLVQYYEFLHDNHRDTEKERLKSALR